MRPTPTPQATDAPDGDMPEPSYTVAPAPFNRPDADIILVSSDHIKFSCHKAILSIASPFFADMFSLPQPTLDPNSSLTDAVLLPLSERGRIIHDLLRLVYPVVAPPLDVLGHTVDVVRAGRKYQMADHLRRIAEDALNRLSYEQPLESYVRCCRFEMEENASRAARSLFLPAGYFPVPAQAVKIQQAALASIHNGTMQGLGTITAGAYFRLRQYIRQMSTPKNLPNPHHQFVYPASKNYVARNSSTEDVDGSDWVHSCDLFERRPADVFVCSATSLNCRIPAHRFILSLFSPILADEIAASTVVEDGHTLIYLPEDARVLCDLLRFSYGTGSYLPPDNVNVNVNVAWFIDIFAAAQKYAMPAVMGTLRTAFQPSLKSDPLPAYFVAIACGWTDEAEQAALSVMDQDVPVADVYLPQMERCSARAYQNLLDYCTQYTAAVSKVLDHYRTRDGPRAGVQEAHERISRVLDDILGTTPSSSSAARNRRISEMLAERDLSEEPMDKVDKVCQFRYEPAPQRERLGVLTPIMLGSVAFGLTNVVLNPNNDNCHVYSWI
ncbi:hypothetical protein EUX98_g4503 [Antrodiella citrinella]|uniref:BTB domain-containing protein n=1 Tax=Antrodiella citrinella TaxID=2447956 RepID=A0A4S4MWB6_9APHY|nr:hypothetical protein EUX98_g4503 [Antrodiella citrinella]